MSNKKAFVFDTNFIIQNPKLDEVVEKLKDNYTVYITQVSIDERIAQQCRGLKQEFDEVEKCQQKYSHLAEITFSTDYEELANEYRNAIQRKYNSCFGNNIIPFKKTGKALEKIIDRANKKVPPFSCNKDASDKGFKDCLLWLSLLEYFAGNGEDEIVFLTDDKSAFRNYSDFLKEEFTAKTGKTIEIQPNSFYKEIFNHCEPELQKVETEKETIPNIDEFRIQIKEILETLIGVQDEDWFGNPVWIQTFTTSIPFDKSYVKSFFEGLRSDISSHIFETSVPASKTLGLDDRVIDGNAEIPIKNLEEALRLYQKVLNNYSQYSEQFFEAATKILNQNYVAPKIDDKEEELPF